MMHIQWFKPGRYYQTQDETSCIPESGEKLCKKQQFFFSEEKEWEGKTYAILEEIKQGLHTGTMIIYQTSNRPDCRVPFVALHPDYLELHA